MPGVAEAVRRRLGLRPRRQRRGRGRRHRRPTEVRRVARRVATARPWRMAEGTFPSGPDEVVLDRLSADQGDIEVGDTVTVTAQAGAREFTVVGIVTFGDADTSGGANWALFDLPTAQDFVIGQPGLLDSITVVGDGSLDDQAARRLDPDRPRRRRDRGAHRRRDHRREPERGRGGPRASSPSSSPIFAAISLFVGSFIIYNVFSISAAQRQQENALLRAIGASRSQVTRVAVRRGARRRHRRRRAGLHRRRAAGDDHHARARGHRLRAQRRVARRATVGAHHVARRRHRGHAGVRHRPCDPLGSRAAAGGDARRVGRPVGCQPSAGSSPVASSW